MHRGTRLDRSTAAARILANGSKHLPKKTSLDELDEDERHEGAAFSDWFGIRVDEPERAMIMSLSGHTQSCTEGKMIIDCPGEKVEAPQTAIEKTFFPSNHSSKESLRWLEQEAKRRRINIHHATCEHDGYGGSGDL